MLEWTRRPRVHVLPREPEPPLVPRPARLVSDMRAEQERGMRLRAWRDVGALVGPALTGGVIAAYVEPPVTGIVAGCAAAWLLALALAVRHVAGRAQGRGVIGTAEGNAAYFQDPESYAVGGAFGFTVGAGLGLAAMVLALVADM